MTAAELNPELRLLIDERLEAIDRALASAQVSWPERRSIVGEVETQVFELLSRRETAPAKEDLIALLATLDPPESYIPEELRESATSAPPAWRFDWSPERCTRMAKRGAGIVAVGMGVFIVNVVVVGLIASTHGLIPWLVTLSGLVWLNIAAWRQVRSRMTNGLGPLLADLRHALAAWILPKNGAQRT
ncbi:MAG: hypothetical protein ACKV0T_31490 [Planctomycetales bacterium]